MNDVQIFTTPILDGIKIKEYKGIVITRNVRAINIVRDFLTSFRDIFGGCSGSYQEVMKSMQDDVIAEAKEEARKLGANAIVGFALDYDNVGSKNKSQSVNREFATGVLTHFLQVAFVAS
ncbi:MAG: YbjQ family protein [Planctomycetota bacterium]